jgi:hypothetical protein
MFDPNLKFQGLGFRQSASSETRAANPTSLHRATASFVWIPVMFTDSPQQRCHHLTQPLHSCRCVPYAAR